MPRIVPLDPELLSYQRRLAVDGVELVFDVEWRQRPRAWWITIRDSSEAAIVGPRRVALNWSLNLRKVDPRLPDGEFLIVRIGDSDAEPTVEELGREVELQYWTRAELEAITPTLDDGIARVRFPV